MKYYFAMTKIEILLLAPKWMQLETIMLKSDRAVSNRQISTNTMFSVINGN